MENASYQLKGRKHGILYKKKLTKKIKFKKRQFFMKTKESRFSFYLYFIFKPWCFPLGLY
jgi:hypothetical protein